MAYGDFKDLNKRTESDKILKDKALEIASDPKCDGYQRGLDSMVYKLSNKKSISSGINSIPNQQLADKLHKHLKI